MDCPRAEACSREMARRQMRSQFALMAFFHLRIVVDKAYISTFLVSNPIFIFFIFWKLGPNSCFSSLPVQISQVRMERAGPRSGLPLAKTLLA